MKTVTPLRALPTAPTERDALTCEFPRVPAKIIDTVLDAYRALMPSEPAAVHAARLRIRDACAT